MKKIIPLLLLMLLLLALPAQAQEAEDLTPLCGILVGSKAITVGRLSDRDYDTVWLGDNAGKNITINSPKNIHGLYICWAETPRDFVLEEKVDGQWRETLIKARPFKHDYYPISGATEVRLKPAGNSRKWFGVAELFVLGAGDLPPYVQTWKEPGLSCDLLLLHAHPDDEVLFFGGTLPHYAGELKKNVVVAALTSSRPLRESELLNSLWKTGVRNYPVIASFYDKHSLKLKTAYEIAGKNKAQRFAVELLRRYKPQVVVTHDVKGEYGHGMHQLCADLMLYAFDVAADPQKYKDTATQYGAWQMSKLYLHLYRENPLVMDWDQPLSAFSGQTAFEVAQDAYRMHVSQQRYKQYKVEPRDSDYSSYHYGLARTTVGPDVAQNDFLENIVANPYQVEGQ